MASEFRVGDLVWGKIETHPWWPGEIYDEAQAKSSVMQRKTKGSLLVSFFGDDTYCWIHPTNLLPFERHFLSKSKQSKSEAFQKAVEDAMDEVEEREKAAFSCQCGKPYSGYEYPMDQIERFRRELNPAEMVSFLHKLALEPMDLTRDGHFMRNVARFLAYRWAVFAEDATDCPTYKEAYVGPDGWSDEDSDDRGEALPQGAASTNVSEIAEVPAPKGKRKDSSSGHSSPNKARSQSKRAKLEKFVDGPKLQETDRGQASADQPSRIRSKCPQQNQDAFLDKEALVSKPPSKCLSRTVSPEKGMGKTVAEPPSRNTGMELALISKPPSEPLSRILLIEKAVGDNLRDPPSKRIEEEKLASPEGGAEANLEEPGVILHIKFPPQAPLPSTSELKAKFARFGRLDTSATYSSWKSPKCHVCFKRASDAEAARDHLRKNGNMYNNTKVSCYLESLKVAPSPKSSESNDFTNPPHHWSSNSGERASRSEGGERSITVSSEVNRQEGRTEKYQQITPPAPPAYLECSSHQAVSQLANVRDKKHLEASQATTMTATAATSTVDISVPMLKLLKEVEKCVENLKHGQKHRLYEDYKKV